MASPQLTKGKVPVVIPKLKLNWNDPLNTYLDDCEDAFIEKELFKKTQR